MVIFAASGLAPFASAAAAGCGSAACVGQLESRPVIARVQAVARIAIDWITEYWLMVLWLLAGEMGIYD